MCAGAERILFSRAYYTLAVAAVAAASYRRRLRAICVRFTRCRPRPPSHLHHLQPRTLVQLYKLQLDAVPPGSCWFRFAGVGRLGWMHISTTAFTSLSKCACARHPARPAATPAAFGMYNTWAIWPPTQSSVPDSGVHSGFGFRLPCVRVRVCVFYMHINLALALAHTHARTHSNVCGCANLCVEERGANAID